MEEKNEKDFLEMSKTQVDLRRTTELLQNTENFISFLKIFQKKENFSLCNKILEYLHPDDPTILRIISSNKEIVEEAFIFLEKTDEECLFGIYKLCDIFANSFIARPIEFMQNFRFGKGNFSNLFKHLDNNDIFYCVQHCVESTQFHNPYFYYVILAALDFKEFSKHKGLFIEALVYGEPDIDSDLKLSRLQKERLVMFMNKFLNESTIESTVFDAIEAFIRSPELELDIDFVFTIAAHFEVSDDLVKRAIDTVKNEKQSNVIEKALLYLSGADLKENEIKELIEAVFMKENVKALHMKMLTSIIKFVNISIIVPILKEFIPKAWNRKIISMRPFIIELAYEFDDDIKDSYPSFFDEVVYPFNEDKPYKRTFAFQQSKKEEA